VPKIGHFSLHRRARYSFAPRYSPWEPQHFDIPLHFTRKRYTEKIQPNFPFELCLLNQIIPSLLEEQSVSSKPSTFRSDF
jgi:hypothetical protein